MNAQAPPPPIEDRLARLFAERQAGLLGMLYCVLGQRDDAQDALQEAFVKCWRHRQEAALVDNLPAWVFRVALNTGRDLRNGAWRRKRTAWTEEQMAQTTSAECPDQEAVRAEELARVRAALVELRAEEQEVFLLRQNGDLTYEQIGSCLGLPVGTVKTRMRLALERLRVRLRGAADDADQP